MLHDIYCSAAFSLGRGVGNRGQPCPILQGADSFRVCLDTQSSFTFTYMPLCWGWKLIAVVWNETHYVIWFRMFSFAEKLPLILTNREKGIWMFNVQHHFGERACTVWVGSWSIPHVKSYRSVQHVNEIISMLTFSFLKSI